MSHVNLGKVEDERGIVDKVRIREQGRRKKDISLFPLFPVRFVSLSLAWFKACLF